MYIQSHVHHFPPSGCDAPERRALYSRTLKACHAVDQAVADVASQDNGPHDLNRVRGQVSLYDATAYRTAELGPGRFTAEQADGTRLGHQATVDEAHYEFHNASDWLEITWSREGTTVVEKLPVEPPAAPEPVKRASRLEAFFGGATHHVFGKGPELLRTNHALATELGLEDDAESRRLATHGYTSAGLMFGAGVVAGVANSFAALPLVVLGMGMSGVTTLSLANRQHQLAGQVDQLRQETHLAEFEAFLSDPTISKV